MGAVRVVDQFKELQDVDQSVFDGADFMYWDPGQERLVGGTLFGYTGDPGETDGDTTPTILSTATVPAKSLTNVSITAKGTFGANATTKYLMLYINDELIWCNEIITAPNGLSWIVSIGITDDAGTLLVVSSGAIGSLSDVQNYSIVMSLSEGLVVKVVGQNSVPNAGDVTCSSLVVAVK